MGLYDESRGPIGAITTDDIEDIKRDVKIGDRISFRDETCYSPHSAEALSRRLVSGTVIEKHRHYCTLVTESGYKESIKWIDLILIRKRKEENEQL